MKKIKKFYKGLFIYFGILLIISGVVLGILWNFLKCYEYSKPDSIMMKIASMIEDGELNNKATEYLGIKSNIFETKEIEEEYFADITKDKQVEFKLISEESDDIEKKYFISAGEDEIVKVTLKASPKAGGFGFDKWEVKDSVFIKEYKIIVPENYDLFINGEEVGSEYISSSQSMIPEKEEMYEDGNQWGLPYMVEYTVSGFLKDPEVYVENDGEKVVLTLDNQFGYIYPFTPQHNFSQENTDWIIGVAEDYGKYITKDAEFGDIASHLLYGSDVYTNIQTLEIRWYAEHESYEFKDEEVNNFKMYSDKCFSCDVHFKQIIYSMGKPIEYNTDLNWTFVNKNGNWVLAEMDIIASE